MFCPVDGPIKSKQIFESAFYGNHLFAVGDFHFAREDFLNEGKSRLKDEAAQGALLFRRG